MRIMLVIIILISISTHACVRQEISEAILSDYSEAKNLYIKGDLDTALQHFCAIKKKAPTFANNLFMIGKIYFFQKKYEEAEKTWTALMDRQPYHMDTVKWLARMYLQENKIEQAEPLVTRALAYNSDDPELLLLFAKVKANVKDYSTAIEFYKKALLFEERLVEAHIDLSDMYRSFGLTERACSELERALGLLDRKSALYDPIHAMYCEIKEDTR
jgi:tetratricopeptide (TPR) repeat protein